MYTGLYLGIKWDYIGILQKKMDITIMGFRVWGLGV